MVDQQPASLWRDRRFGPAHVGSETLHVERSLLTMRPLAQVATEAQGISAYNVALTVAQ
jgi:hypothetical protein